jgi:hypothetical protein
LLAEQQAMEEARRRDPVKRAAIWVGMLAGGMLAWTALIQMEISRARGSLEVVEARLKTIEENSKDLHTAWQVNGQIESRLALLDKYTTNRFYWAVALNALQQTVIDQVRVMQFKSSHTYANNAEVRFRTNVVVSLEPRSKWRFWEGRQNIPDIQAMAASRLEGVLQRSQFSRAPELLATKVQYTTNRTRVSANIEVALPKSASESIVFSLMARDYSNPPGRQVNEFLQRLGQLPYFQETLHRMEGQGVRLRERGIQPEVESEDPIYPGRAFIPFVIDCRYEERVRAL